MHGNTYKGYDHLRGLEHLMVGSESSRTHNAGLPNDIKRQQSNYAIRLVNGQPAQSSVATSVYRPQISVVINCDSIVIPLFCFCLLRGPSLASDPLYTPASTCQLSPDHRSTRTTMTEYDFSPEAYDRYIQNQNRVANWVHHTEQHRQVFEAAVPGAPGVFPVPRRQSPPIPEHYISPHRPSPAYPKPPIYHRALASSSSSEDSYVHVAAPPQIHRLRPPPPPIYAPPRPPLAPLPAQPYSSPVVFRVDGDRLSSDSPRHRHIRSKSHSHPHRSPPPLVTPIYTSPPASHFIPPPPIIYMSFQGHPIPSRSRPVIHPRERYGKPPSPGPRIRDQPPTPPTSPLRSPSSSDTPISVYHPLPHTQDPILPVSADLILKLLPHCGRRIKTKSMANIIFNTVDT
ncbi:hypothetical protein P691DRAFT_780407 [Macrolepiota fuliginosa MF-IS2]|uniref:Uncharacterized protein n=1 Tax=Macrolepiota fuliginosa MF-IS2 TaxID=1400762 RepID=A0A9P5XQK4_9AGAR|nr:hypothetical protein P691DRAFT_780407 [Macrolepiota fuliginosa MF-IS2]